ncbi:MAG TPA: hypothetical protein VLJ59_08740 [Mycobacteriales bacterium]|nr:hypothetical protein [Mycobacteriales bacterium]
MGDDAELRLRVEPAPDGDAEELAELTRLLRAELLDLRGLEPYLTSVESPDDEAAPGPAKGLGALLGELVVRLGPEGLRAAVAAVRGWASRTNRTVEVNIDGDVLKLTGVTSEQQDRVIDGWLARHAAGA